jgi:threonine synthase
MFVSHLESALDGTRFEAGRIHSTHKGRPLWVRYDLTSIRTALRPDDLLNRPPTLWRYREFLPLPFQIDPITLGEGMTPLLPCDRLGEP